MIKQVWYEFGTVFGMMYEFSKRGDGLTMHRHQPQHEHNVIVLEGAIAINGVPFESWDIIAEFPDDHEIVALVGGTVILNLYKYGKPSEYDHLPDSEKSVTFESPNLLGE